MNSHTLVNPACSEEVELYHNLGRKAKSFSNAPKVQNNKPDSKPSKIPLSEARRSYKHIGAIGKKQYTLIILTFYSRVVIL